MKKWIATISLLAAISLAEGTKTLPSFSLNDVDGKPHVQTEYAGKVVLIDFWATWCSSCKQIAPKVQEIYTKYSPKGLVVLGVSTDNDKRMTLEKIKKSAAKEGLTYPILWDEKGTLSEALQFKSVPSLFLFNDKGELVKSFDGYSETAVQEIEAELTKILP